MFNQRPFSGSNEKSSASGSNTRVIDGLRRGFIVEKDQKLNWLPGPITALRGKTADLGH